jgi:hypothetical protein
MLEVVSMKYEVGDLLFVEAGSWTPNAREEHYIVKLIDYSDEEEEYSYVVYNMIDNETEYINNHWVEKWAKKVG